MQISHSFLRTGEAKCSSCIEMRVEPHSKVVSRREYAYPLRKQDIYVMEGVGFGGRHIDRRLDRRACARRSRLCDCGLHSLLPEALRQKRDAGAYVRSAEPVWDGMPWTNIAHPKTP